MVFSFLMVPACFSTPTSSTSGDGEVRRKVVGMIEERLFTVVYTERDGVTRIISARRCNAKEGKLYGPV
jgi:uncharacterized DUF497 family protein